MKDILVSIVVPIYGVEKFIVQCARSLFAKRASMINNKEYEEIIF